MSHHNITHDQKQRHCATTFAIKSSKACSFCHLTLLGRCYLYDFSVCRLPVKAVTYVNGGNASRISNLALKAAGDGLQIL